MMSLCKQLQACVARICNMSLCKQLELPRTPCLLYTTEYGAANAACLYSLTEKQVYNLTLPDPPIRTRHLIGSSHGWLVTADAMSELHLLNPATDQQMALPSVTTNERVNPVFDDAGTIIGYEFELDGWKSIYAVDEFRDHFHVKAYLFPDPSTGSHIVALIHDPSLELSLSFARVGDSKWTSLPQGWDYEDCVYMDGLLYALTGSGQVDAFDLTDPPVTVNRIADGTMENHHIFGRLYLVPAPSGDLLQVHRNADLIVDMDGDEKAMHVTDNVVVYKVDMAAKELVLMDGLHDDQVLFLGRGQSQCLGAQEFPQLKPNCVYFTDDERRVSDYKNDCRDIGVINLEDGSRDEISPRVWCSWPNPIWVTPSLARIG